MRSLRSYPVFDPDLIVDQIVMTLSAVPLDTRKSILGKVQNRITAEPGAALDQDISVLHHWGALSTRCYTTLTRSFRSNETIPSDQPIRLSDIARLSSKEMSTISNLGKQSLIEIFNLLESCGSGPRDLDIFSTISRADRISVRQKMAARMAEQSAAYDRDVQLLKNVTEFGANWQKLAERFGCSERRIRIKVAAAAKRTAFGDANPVSLRREDLHPRD